MPTPALSAADLIALQGRDAARFFTQIESQVRHLRGVARCTDERTCHNAFASAFRGNLRGRWARGQEDELISAAWEQIRYSAGLRIIALDSWSAAQRSFPRVLEPFLVGSVARGEGSPTSDFDFAAIGANHASTAAAVAQAARPGKFYKLRLHNPSAPARGWDPPWWQAFRTEMARAKYDPGGRQSYLFAVAAGDIMPVRGWNLRPEMASQFANIDSSALALPGAAAGHWNRIARSPFTSVKVPFEGRLDAMQLPLSGGHDAHLAHRITSHAWQALAYMTVGRSLARRAYWNLPLCYEIGASAQNYWATLVVAIQAARARNAAVSLAIVTDAWTEIANSSRPRLPTSERRELIGALP